MPPAFNGKGPAVIHHGAHPILLLRKMCERCRHVKFGQSGGQSIKAFRVVKDLRAELREDFAFNLACPPAGI